MISLIVPIYNKAKFLPETLNAIAKQSFRDFELLLVDDGSIDDSVAVAETVLKKSDLTYQILRKENGGQSSARNYGLDRARGDYVLYLDSDDVISPDFLERLSSSFHETVDFVFCGFCYVKAQTVPQDDDHERYLYTRDELIWHFLKRDISFVVPSMLFRKSFLLEHELRFREGIRYSEDQLFIWEVLFKAAQAVYLPAKLYGYCLRESSIMTGSPYERIMDGFRVYASFCEELKEKYANHHKEIAMILPRWELGTLYTAANLLDYEQYKKIYETMDGRSIFRRLKGINEPKAYLLAAVCSLSPGLLYALCRRLDLNG